MNQTVNHKMNPLQPLPQRTLGEILNETIAVYARHFWRFVFLVGVVQAPISLLGLIGGEGATGYAVVSIISVIASMVVYGAAMVAVGQHYVTGDVDIRVCYFRVWWRIISLLTVTLALSLSVAGGVTLMMMGASMTVITVYLFPLTAFIIYGSMSMPAVVFEGYRPVGALRRSFSLVHGNWWRVFCNFLIYSLVAMGLMLLLLLPFLLTVELLNVPTEDMNVLSLGIQFVSSVVVGVVVPPIFYVAGTLLYYDLRVRKEGYDLITLSEEMGESRLQMQPVAD